MHGEHIHIVVWRSIVAVGWGGGEEKEWGRISIKARNVERMRERKAREKNWGDILLLWQIGCSIYNVRTSVLLPQFPPHSTSGHYNFLLLFLRRKDPFESDFFFLSCSESSLDPSYGFRLGIIEIFLIIPVETPMFSLLSLLY